MIKVLIVDDQVLLRESLAYIINTDNEIEVVALAGNGNKAYEMIKEKAPDVILMDIQMPDGNGLAATKKIKKKYPDTKVIILTTFEETSSIMEACAIGVDGYLIKDIGHEELILAIKCVAMGLSVMHESVKKMMSEKFQGSLFFQEQYIDRLSEEEVVLVRHVGSGKSNRQIAELMSFSEGTIKNKISKVFEKLEVKDRVQLTVFAIENMLI